MTFLLSSLRLDYHATSDLLVCSFSCLFFYLYELETGEFFQDLFQQIMPYHIPLHKFAGAGRTSDVE